VRTAAPRLRSLHQRCVRTAGPPSNRGRSSANRVEHGSEPRRRRPLRLRQARLQVPGGRGSSPLPSWFCSRVLSPLRCCSRVVTIPHPRAAKPPPPQQPVSPTQPRRPPLSPPRPPRARRRLNRRLQAKPRRPRRRQPRRQPRHRPRRRRLLLPRPSPRPRSLLPRRRPDQPQHQRRARRQRRQPLPQRSRRQRPRLYPRHLRHHRAFRCRGRVRRISLATTPTP